MKVLMILVVVALSAGWISRAGSGLEHLEPKHYRFDSIEQRLAYLVPKVDDERPILIPEDWLPLSAEFGDVLAVVRELERDSKATTFRARVELVGR